MTRGTTPSDYNAEDGWDDGIECCPCCDRVYSANGGYTGAVYNRDGARFTSVLDAAVDNGPYFCAECWDVLETNVRASENRSVTEYTQEQRRDTRRERERDDGERRYRHRRGTVPPPLPPQPPQNSKGRRGHRQQ